MNLNLIVFFLFLFYVKISDLANEYPELKENKITIGLDEDDIEQAQAQEQNIIIPSEIWDDLIEEIQIEDQPWYNSIELDVSNIEIPKLETITNSLITQNTQPNQPLTISSLMSNPQSKNGITKDSTLIINVPQQSLETITNYQISQNTQPNQSLTISSLMSNPQSNDGITKNSTLIINVPQPITTNNFRQINSNNTYSLSTLYQGQDNPVGFKPDSQIEIRVPQTTLDITQISNYSITNNGNQNVPIPTGYDAVDSINLNVNVKFSINRFYLSTYYKTLSNFTSFSSNLQLTINSNEACVWIVETINDYVIKLLVNNDNTNKSITLTIESNTINKYVKFGQTNGYSTLNLSNNTTTIKFICNLYQTICSFNSWSI